MAGIGDGDFIGPGRGPAKADRHRGRRRVCHGETLAARGVLRWAGLRGRWHDQRTEQGDDGGSDAQHGKAYAK